MFATFELPCGRGVDPEIFILKVFKMLRSFIFYQQLMFNRLMGGRMVVLGGEECQKSRGETGLLFNSRNGNDVQ